MPVSEKQINANRQNSKKSTGPKTPEGKEKVSQNAIKHGLSGDKIIIDSPHFKEDKTECDILLNSLIDERNPTTHFQQLSFLSSFIFFGQE